MNIDEAVFERAFGPDPVEDEHASALWRHLHASVEAYLRGLPPAEPGRDRIAVVVNRLGLGHGWVLDPTFKGDLSSQAWEDIEAECMESIEHPQSQVEFAGPYARAIVRCNLPRPAEPVEVEGSVEGVES